MRLVVVAVVLALSTTAHGQKIVIDPGHGGEDPGGAGTGMQEKTVVLDVSKRFKALLDADTADTAGGGSWTSLMTRSSDVTVSLAARSQYSNNQDADRFMSIHSNAFGSTSANGTETFSLAEGTVGAQLRNLVQAEMVAAWKLTNRGNKTANFAVLRDTAAPAELHELAFITNATDAAKLASPDERQKAAVAHLRAIQRHYNIAPYVPGNVLPPPPMEGDGSITGHVVNESGPVAGAIVKLDGGTSVVTTPDGAFLFEAAAAGEHVLAASADGHTDASVTITVAASVRAEVEIVLARSEGPGDGDGNDDEPTTEGGCSSTSGAGLLVLIALGALRRRRR